MESTSCLSLSSKKERKEKKRSKKRKLENEREGERDEREEGKTERQTETEREMKEEKKRKKERGRERGLGVSHHLSLLEDRDKGADTFRDREKETHIEIAETKEDPSSSISSSLSPSDPTPSSLASSSSKLDFFSKLMAKERLAPRVGTFHAVGKKSDNGSAEVSKDWTCPKCSTSNYRHSHQCQKCKAVKRMSDWR